MITADILEFLKDKENVPLKDIYALFVDVKVESVRGIVNGLVKKGRIKRTGTGLYSHI